MVQEFPTVSLDFTKCYYLGQTQRPSETVAICHTVPQLVTWNVMDTVTWRDSEDIVTLDKKSETRMTASVLKRDRNI